MYESPLGRLTLAAGPAGLSALRFPGRGGAPDPADRTTHGLDAAVAQLEQYFADERRAFELALDLRGTEFQHRVVGADGSLTGYGGGLERKQALLDLEASVAAGLAPEPAWAFRQLAL